MSSDRRYTEQEIEAIFKQAAEAQETASRERPHGEGLTIAELQEIGGEAGITPEFIAQAAASLERTSTTAILETLPEPRDFLGIPTHVQYTVELPGTLSDKDWELLVVDCRELFAAQGRAEAGGSLRQWRNGNLHVLLEPTATGQRLRMGSMNSRIRSALTGSAMAIAMAIFLAIATGLSGELANIATILFIAAIAVAGVGLRSWATSQSSEWSRRRGLQFRALATRAEQMITGRAESGQVTGTKERAGTMDLDIDLEAPSAPGDPVHSRTKDRS
jgi:uncharacterized MAPEG superfamily protein